MRFWADSCPEGSSHLAQPLPGSKCYTASPSKPLCIHSKPLCTLFWPGFFCYGKGIMLLCSLSTHGNSCPGSAQKLPTSAQGRCLRKRIRYRESNSLRDPYQSVTPRLPEPAVVQPSTGPYSTELPSFLKTDGQFLWLTCVWCEENISFGSFQIHCLVIAVRAHGGTLIRRLPDRQGFVESCPSPAVIPAMLGSVSLSSVLV